MSSAATGSLPQASERVGELAEATGAFESETSGRLQSNAISSTTTPRVPIKITGTTTRSSIYLDRALLGGSEAVSVEQAESNAQVDNDNDSDAPRDDLSHALIKLSSQYHFSEYNQLKRSMFQPVVPPRQTSKSPILAAASVASTSSSHQLTQNWPASRPTSSTSITPRKRAGSPTCSTATGEQPSSTHLTPSVDKLVIESNLRSEPREALLAVEQLEEEALEVVKPRPTALLPSPFATPALRASVPPQFGVPDFVPGMRMMNGIAVKTSVSHPMNVSAIIPPELLSSFHASLFSTGGSAKGFSQTDSSRHVPFVVESHAGTDMTLVEPTASTSQHHTGHEPQRQQDRIGNLLLSSCPGKKVRLDAPPTAKSSRSAICRDTKADLARARQEGTRVVVCCLDDDELALLGSPWAEYARAASELGLKVVRVPMAEGFAPVSPAYLDAHLDALIRAHTLAGESVLVHCRGGIGRAGLVACCWLLKMGFVGPVIVDRDSLNDDGRGEIDEQQQQQQQQQQQDSKDDDGGGERAMEIVERVIRVIRQRRSIKSIETPQQVHFLLEYVEYLRAHARVVPASHLV